MSLKDWNVSEPESIELANLAIRLLTGEIRHMKLTRAEKAWKKAQRRQLVRWVWEQEQMRDAA